MPSSPPLTLLFPFQSLSRSSSPSPSSLPTASQFSSPLLPPLPSSYPPSSSMLDFEFKSPYCKEAQARELWRGACAKKLNPLTKPSTNLPAIWVNSLELGTSNLQEPAFLAGMWLPSSGDSISHWPTSDYNLRTDHKPRPPRRAIPKTRPTEVMRDNDHYCLRH